MTYSIISVRDCPQYLDRAVDYFASKWSVAHAVYQDSISHSVTSYSSGGEPSRRMRVNL